MKPFLLLVSPPRTRDGKDLTYENILPPEYPPLNLAYLAGYLENQGYEIKIVDSNTERDIKEKISRIITNKKPVLIGFTSTSPLFYNTRTIANFVKEQYQNIPTVLGGIHATLMPELMNEDQSFDFLVFGEGEQTLFELANALKDGHTNFDEIDGLVFRKEDKVIKNKARKQIEDLDKIPFPRRNLFESHRYQYPDTIHKETTPIITSRGCPGVCTYCASRNMFPQIRLRSAENVVEEIEILVKDSGIKEIHIWDDCFTLLKDRVFKIRDLIKKKNIKVKFAFPNGVRADMVNQDVLKALKEMGTYSIAFAPETGSLRILNSIKKNFTLDQTREAFSLAKKLKLETWGFFMIGLPGETEEDINKTIDFAIEVNPDIVKFNILMPFPGTEVRKQLLEENLILEKDYSKYGFHSRPVHRLSVLSTEDLVRLHSKAYRKFYLRPVKLLQQVLRLRSWQRIKTNLKTGIMVFKLMFKKKRLT